MITRFNKKEKEFLTQLLGWATIWHLDTNYADWEEENFKEEYWVDFNRADEIYTKLLLKLNK